MSRNVYSSEIVINKEINKVFDFTVDFNNYYLWSGSHESGYLTPPPTQENTQFFEKYRLRGRLQQAEGIVTNFEKNKTWSYKTILAGYSLDGVYDFEQIATDKTKVISTVSLNIDNPLQMMMLFRLINHLFAKRQIDKNMTDLKKIIQNHE